MPNVTREKGRLYFVDKAGEVVSAKLGGGEKRPEGVKVVREVGYFYFVDGSGEVKRKKR